MGGRSEGASERRKEGRKGLGRKQRRRASSQGGEEGGKVQWVGWVGRDGWIHGWIDRSSERVSQREREN